jgi:hypothetical protein
MNALNFGPNSKKASAGSYSTLYWAISVSAVIGLLVIASPLWGGSHENQTLANDAKTKLVQAGAPVETGVPDAATVFRGNTAIPEEMAPTF